MIRQRIRKAIILISFLLFPVTMFYLSPALIFKGARLGIISGSFITFIILFKSGYSDKSIATIFVPIIKKDKE